MRIWQVANLRERSSFPLGWLFCGVPPISGPALCLPFCLAFLLQGAHRLKAVRRAFGGMARASQWGDGRRTLGGATHSPSPSSPPATSIGSPSQAEENLLVGNMAENRSSGPDFPGELVLYMASKAYNSFPSEIFVCLEMVWRP